MIFYNYNTITIDRFALCFEFPNNIKRFNIWLPKKLVDRKFNKLVVKYNENTNKSKLDNILDDRYHAANLEIRIKLMVVLFDVLKNSWLLDPPSEILSLFKKYFKKDFEITDLQMIIDKIELLKSRLKTLIKNLEAPKSEEFDFIKLVMNLEGILSTKIGSEKLYKLSYYIDVADKKANKE